MGVGALGASTAAADPALVKETKGLVCVYRVRGSNQIRSADYDSFRTIWKEPVQLPGTTTAAPALGTYGSQTVCVVRASGASEKLYWSTRPNGSTTWSAFTEIPDVTSADAPALAEQFNTGTPNRLYCLYRG
ncbi:hypothetical protein OG455_37750 [Kitasatospora sp. NBC_01287]|uniref:hypothetical protein n=1 Tax=Kitasatospora sp. NBC_01287 TaxID=2903573 RepID=UPI002252FBAA|nr:hypothetical protein [Kitasatospora sp. NBC_01287]MCX4751186.1 hypothetical protein [Kitasatospora sp. NBC_01287]